MLSLAEIAISACRDSYLKRGAAHHSEVVSCASFCTFRCKKRMLSQKERAESEPFDTLQRYLCMQR